jgi:hypothetical protein
VARLPTAPVTDPETGETVSYETYYNKYKRPPPFGNGVK